MRTYLVSSVLNRINAKNGGGIGLSLSNLRARGETIKEVPNVCKGVVAVAKLFDNALRYADQAGKEMPLYLEINKSKAL